MKHLLLTTIAILIIATTVCAEPIHDAATLGDLDLVQAELDKGIDVNIKDSEYGGTPLHFAAYGGSLNIVKFLLANEADIDVGNNRGWTALFYAAGEGHLDVVEFLIAENANADWRDDNLRRADYHSKKHKEITSLLLEQIEDSIFKAAELGDIDSVKQFLDGGVDVKNIEILGSALHYAIHANHKKVAEFLIARGADVNARNGWGRTPLFFINGSVELLEFLLENGADIDARDLTGSTVLHYASLYQMPGIGGPARPSRLAVELLRVGAEINIRDDEGKTPLDWAQDRFANKNMGLITQNGGRKGEDELQYQLKLLQQSFAKLQHLIIADDQVLNQPSIEKLQGVFVIRGKTGEGYEIQYHVGDNDWKVLEVVKLQSNRQLYIDSSSYDEKRFYRIKLVE
jgi:ankyrin repeat protein